MPDVRDDEPTQCGTCGKPMPNWGALRHHFVAVHVFGTEPDDYVDPTYAWPDAEVVTFGDDA